MYFCNSFRPPVRKKTPPPVATHRFSRSLERKPDVVTEEVVTYPVTKTPRQTQPKGTSLISLASQLTHACS